MPTLKNTLHKTIDDRSSEWLDRQIVWLGDYAQDVLTDVPGVLYARQINGKVIEVYNHTAMVPATFDLQVLIGRSKTLPTTWQIIAIRETYDTPAGGGQLAYHHTQHEYPSADTVWIDRKQVIPLTVLVSDSANFIVRVYGAVIHTASGVRQVSTQLVDLSSYVVTVGAKFITIETDDEGVLTVHEGTAFDAPEIGTYADIPVPATGKYLIAYVLLYDGQAVLSDNDIRVPFPLPGAARSHTHAMDAADVTYTPGVLADWDYSNDPGDVEDGLDQLAERVTDIEAVGGSTEGIQDIVGAMFSGNTETGITADYQDADGTIDLIVAGALTNSNISPTTANVSAAVNTRYFADVSGLTASRNFIVPAGAVGDIIELNIKAGDDTYALIVIGDTGITINGGSSATEWSRLFITGETIQLIADTTSNWILMIDKRIPCFAEMDRITTSITTNSAGTKTTVDWNNIPRNRGELADTTNDRFNIRRAGQYEVSFQYRPANSVTDQKYISIILFGGASGATEFGYAVNRVGATGAATLCVISNRPVTCAVADQIIAQFATEEANIGMLRNDAGDQATGGSWYSIKEVL